MRRSHSIRRVSVVALLFAASVATVVASGPAGATAGGTVVCGDANGTQESPTSLFDCSDSLNSDATGGAGTLQINPPKDPFPVFVGTRTGTIYWSGPTMSQAAQTVVRVTTRVVKKKKNTLCLSSGTTPHSTELRVSGSVRSDTSGVVTVGGPVSAILCESTNGSYALLKNSSFVVGG